MESFTLVFLSALALGLILQLWLAARQASHIVIHAERVPAAFAERITTAEHQKAASYSLARLGVERWDLALSALVVVVWTLGGGLNWLDEISVR